MSLNLVAATGTVVHAPATVGQTVTYLTACQPLGRLGVRRPHYRWTSAAEVTCKSCIRCGGPLVTTGTPV